MTPCLTATCKWVTANARGSFLLSSVTLECRPIARTRWITEPTKQLTRSVDFARIAARFPSICLTIPISETHHVAITRICYDYRGDYT